MRDLPPRNERDLVTAERLRRWPSSWVTGRDRADDRFTALEEWFALQRARANLFGPRRAWRLAGRYEVGSMLGWGARGAVFRAHDHRLRREVRVEFVRVPDGGSRRDAGLREAWALATLGHPSIVEVLDVGVLANGDPEGREPPAAIYLVMQLVEGRPITRWARDVDASTLLTCFAAVAAAMAHAHGAGITHGDISPSNILVDAQGHPTISGFGLASVASAIARDDPRPRRVERPASMAPEQPTALGDQRAFFLVLLESLAAQHEPRTAVPIPAWAAGTVRPRWLRSAIRRGLSADPAERFASMAEVVELLERHRTIRKARSSIGVAGLAAVGFAVGVVTGAFAVRDAPPRTDHVERVDAASTFAPDPQQCADASLERIEVLARRGEVERARAAFDELAWTLHRTNGTRPDPDTLARTEALLLAPAIE